MMCERLGFEYDEGAVNYLIETHYRASRTARSAAASRAILLLQVKNYCLFRKTPLKLSNENFDLAVENYFAVM